MDEEIVLDPQPGGTPDGTPATPETPSFNPQDFSYEFRHEQHFPKDKPELIELLQLGRSYRENKAKWDTERNQWTQDRTRYQQYDAFDKALQQNPEFARELRELAQRHSKPQSTQQDPRYAELEKQVNDMSQWRADYELTQEMEALKRTFPNYDWNRETADGNLSRQVLIFMRDKGIQNPEMAFRAMMFEQSTRDAHLQGAQKAAAATQAAAKAGVVSSGGAKIPAKPVQRANGYGQAAEMSLAELGIT